MLAKFHVGSVFQCWRDENILNREGDRGEVLKKEKLVSMSAYYSIFGPTIIQLLLVFILLLGTWKHGLFHPPRPLLFHPQIDPTDSSSANLLGIPCPLARGT